MNNYDEEEIIQLIDDCTNRESKLTDWERSFISSIGDLVNKSVMLSEKQQKTLNNIWERIT